ncbi:anti-sigma regulatory factor [Actinomadura sp. HBU206391]|uniref:anti-sigma regulatory factor n=1 Tax=Actinomadura sp. HBU206391 TaxID=2731692 RepID=UPI00164F6258|nr:anti-sigma regulatory factor [Actinomadura sp. HBU206391]MBC6463063.1 anti-sigma regulatory factor [Actinomadura sp. HBU206391]
MDEVVLAIAAEADLIRVRRELRAQSQRAGLGLVDQTKLITAGSELARNILTYATGSVGTVRVEYVQADGRRGIKATFTDHGPGIEDIEAALTDGFSTNRSLGLGLPGSRRLTDEMTITSAKGSGTTVMIVKWAR